MIHEKSICSLLAVASMLATAPLSAQVALPPAPSSDAVAVRTEDASAQDAFASGEILVTANRRVERLHDVPASITAVSGAFITKMQIVNAQDFQLIAPTLNFQAADEARLFNFSIRGIGTESFSIGVEPSVSTIVDGVVYSRAGAAFDGLGDIERVEILNGPQGTLQGKNASAGVVAVLTRRPNRDKFEAHFSVTAAEDNEYRAETTLTGPINNNLAYRVFAYYRTNDGLVKQITTGDTLNNVESYGTRAKLEWQPTPSLNLLLAGDFSYRKADCCAEPIRVAAASGNVTAAFTGTPVGPDNRYVNFDTPQVGNQKNRGVSLEAKLKLGDFTVTSLSAYRFYQDYASRDRDGTQAPFTGVTPQQLFQSTFPGISAADALVKLETLLLNPLSFSVRNGLIGQSDDIEKSDTYSQEIRLTSPIYDAYDYVFGLYYNNNKVERNVTIAGVRSNIAGNVSFPTPTTAIVNRATAYVLADYIGKVHTRNGAIFGNLNVRPLDKLTVTGGFRLLHEDNDWNQNKVTGPNGDHIGSTIGATMVGANIGTPAFAFSRRYSDTALIGKVSAKYEFTRNLLVYGSWARGYKGRAVDADVFLTQDGANLSPTAPETSRAWEGGVKSVLFGRLLTVNIDYYNTLFQGYQTASTGLDGSGAPVLRSAGKLYTQGVEGEVALRPLPGLTLSGNFLFADNKFGDLFVSPTVNLKGGRPLNAPDTKYGFVGDYEFALGKWKASITGNYTWVSKTLFTNLTDANNPNSVWLRPSFGIANAAVSVSMPEDRYTVTVFVKNAFDKHYVASLRRISGSVGGAGAVAQAIPRDFDRYFGVTLAAAF